MEFLDAIGWTTKAEDLEQVFAFDSLPNRTEEERISSTPYGLRKKMRYRLMLFRRDEGETTGFCGNGFETHEEPNYGSNRENERNLRGNRQGKWVLIGLVMYSRKYGSKGSRRDGIRK